MLKKKTSKPKSPTMYPLGTFVETELGFFYIYSNTKRYRLVSKRVLDSWRPHRVVKSSESALKNYRIVSKMKFRNGSLIWCLGDGKIYLIESGKRRHIVSPDVLDRIGAVEKDIVKVSLDEINLHEPGDPLS